MEEFIAVATIRYYTGEGYGPDGECNNYAEENVLMTHVKDFTEAVKKLEDYYGNDLDTIVKLTLLNGPMAFISKENMDRALTEDII